MPEQTHGPTQTRDNEGSNGHKTLPPELKVGILQLADPLLARCLTYSAAAMFGFMVYLGALEVPTLMAAARKGELEARDSRSRAAAARGEAGERERLVWAAGKLHEIIDLNIHSAAGRLVVLPLAEQEEPPPPGPEIPAKKENNEQERRSHRPARPCDRACKEARVKKELGIEDGRGSSDTATDRLMQERDKDADQIKGDAVSSKPRDGINPSRADEATRVAPDVDLKKRLVKGPDGVKPRKVEDRFPKPPTPPGPPTPPQDPRPRGYVKAAVTGKTVRAAMGCIKAGYNRILNANPSASGKVVVCMDLDRQGKVARASTQSDTVKNRYLAARIITCVKRLTFPRPGGPSVQVCVPFVLGTK